MARIRTIKPEFFKHERLFDLEMETEFPIRVAFTGLWTCVDREGRFEWRPRMLKSEILPFDEIDFSRVLDALMTRGFVIKYEANNREYGYIPSFKTHQVINNRERDSILPQPPDNIEEVDALSTRPPRVITKLKSALGEGKGKERKGKEHGKEGNVTCQAANASDDIREAFDYYNLIAEKFGLTKAIKFSDDRKRLLRARLDEYGLDTWKEAMDKVGSCPHLMGHNDRSWKADLPFFLKKSKFLKHLEGSYEQSNNNTADHERDRRRKAIAAALVN